MGNLNNAVSWITGATGSIGGAACKALARSGSHVVVSDIDFDRAQDLSIQLKDLGVEALPIQLDVSDQKGVESVAKVIKDTFGRLDILVNGAGISPKGENGRVPVENMDVEEWHRVININLHGAFYTSQAAVKLMKENQSGHIVNIASQAGRSYSAVTGAHYAVSKAGLISLTRQMAGELGPSGIYVNAVAPGRIDTPMIKDVAEEVNRQIINNIPLRRLGTPEEVANTILFLVTPQSSYLTGVVIDINGGRLMI
ncbi:SDR family NAD(P)-dependent oxidoreductase [Neobacillus pocheonensis]|jgi:3-oxoacyl-[acyl-carrier protein] reductase|uniref:SDR family NAD(P)-dependent oxidoreductase n=1 Tax=Bacillaceae TaxID=186817 RepID=UPI000BFE5CB2|nr:MULTISPECIES: SDR family NAD(P)-dependent oxidoreductase [unclassified Bacillus (in: firmicutes)]MBV7506959.1 SDR family oxidoreductase [Bacillus sp. sid0103]PGY06737.1 3-oxoacyl-[acyl-carrier-protein] reductase [Bacillus sp. AFS031507]